MSRQAGYRWVADPTQYQAAVTALPGAALPVLEPGCPRRRQRWTEALDWYGLSKTGPAPAARRSSAVVISLGGLFDEPARLLATVSGRRLLAIAEADQLDTFLAELSPSSAVVVAPPSLLPAGVIHRWQQDMACPWGLLTARDLAGMSFVVAKQLAPAGHGDGLRLIDLLSGVFATADRDGIVTEHRRLGDGEGATADDLLARTWQTLIVATHGEGGHVTLRSTVLCGVTGGREQGNGELQLDGCANDVDPPVCRRVKDLSVGIVAVEELRTRELVLYSCNGFDVAGDHFPSDVSIALAAADGFVRSFVTSDRPVLMIDGLAEAVFDLRRSGLAPPALVQTLNDLDQYHSGSRPFLLVGDPGEWRSPPHPDADRSGLLALGELEQSSAVELVDDAGALRSSLQLLRGRTVAVAVGDRDDPGSGSFRLVDRSKELARGLAFLRRVARQILAAGELEKALKVVFCDELGIDPGLDEAFLDLVRTRLVLEDECFVAQHRAAESRRFGVWDPAVAASITTIRDLAGQWDRCFAELFQAHLVARKELWLMLAGYGRRLDPFATQERCVHCGSTLQASRLRSCLVGVASRVHLDCPICAFCRSWVEGGARFTVQLPKALAPGEAGRLVVTARHAGGQLITTVQDRRDGIFFHSLTQMPGRRLEIGVTAPPTLSPNRHSANLVLVHRLDFALARLAFLSS